MYLFYEMCKKRDIDDYKNMAHIVYNAVACGSPADGDKMAGSQKRHWKKFISNFDWDTMMGKAESRAKPDPMNAFRALGLQPGGIIASSRRVK